MTDSDRRVVITGMGLISPLGNSTDSMWQALTTGRSGVRALERIPTEHLPSGIGGEAADFSGHIDDFGDLEKSLKRSIKKGLKLMCREIQMGVAAAQLAIASARLDPADHDPERSGTLYGCDYLVTDPAEFARGIGQCLKEDPQFHLNQWPVHGLGQVEPLWLLKYLPNMPASHIAIYNDLRGPSNSLTMGEASANLAVGEAATIIGRGSADRMVVGATGSMIHLMRTMHVSLQRQLPDIHQSPINGDPARASRPFDDQRDGMVLGEGAGCLVMEELEHARTRNAHILGEVVGHASSLVASRAGVADYETAFSNVLQGVLQSAGVEPDSIGHVSAHGLGTIGCDRDEARAIQVTLGDQVPVVALKSYTGNVGAASGILELVASLMSMQHGHLYPTLNLDQLDQECPINVVDNDSVAPGELFLSVNTTSQGQASSIAIRRFDD